MTNLTATRVCTREELTALLTVLRAVDAGEREAVQVDSPMEDYPGLVGFHGWVLYQVGDWLLDVFIDGGDFDYVEAWREPSVDVLEVPEYTEEVEREMPTSDRFWGPKHPERWGVSRRG